MSKSNDCTEANWNSILIFEILLKCLKICLFILGFRFSKVSITDPVKRTYLISFGSFGLNPIQFFLFVKVQYPICKICVTRADMQFTTERGKITDDRKRRVARRQYREC